jgi:hypothetical protein
VIALFPLKCLPTAPVFFFLCPCVCWVITAILVLMNYKCLSSFSPFLKQWTPKVKCLQTMSKHVSPSFKLPSA